MKCCSSLVFSFLIISSFSSIYAKTQLSHQYPSHANVSRSWANSVGQRTKSSEWETVNPIIVRQTSGSGFICGFYCHYDSNSCLFAVLIYQDEDYPQLVWSANRNNPVRLNATLEFTEQGDLILSDADGTLVWSTNTPGKNVLGLNFTDFGELVLFNTDSYVWNSFNHPTDSMLVGQWLDGATKLRASISDSNWTEGLFSILFTPSGFAAQLDSNPPQLYYEFKSGDSVSVNTIADEAYFWYDNGSLTVFNNDDGQNKLYTYIPYAVSAQYMKLGGDGHLRVYQWQESTSTWIEAADLLKGKIDECGYPLVCGRYGICSQGQCFCPPALTNGTSYFKPMNEKQPNQGCSILPPISCHLSQYHTLLELQNIDYFFFRADIRNIQIQICKQACLKNCSCKAALFKYNSSASVGDCCLLSEVFSLKNIDGTSNYSTSLFLKVQNKTEVAGNKTKTGKRTGHAQMVIGSSLGAFLGVFVCICACLLLLWKRRDSLEVEDHLHWVQEMPTRFSYHELKASTKNFSCKLGEGGFGMVFEGILSNGMKVAVKRLEGLGQVKESFLAEVKTMGNIHHVNLVRLIGFCVEKSHRLLVYEYMCNGSLDKWIFHINKDLTLCWQSRKKIILDIAKGLAYLHEDCMQKIFHLDIKPQNILLDEQLRAKVSDFGLSKLIEKDQSKVVTIMRGTPGYLAPEWLNSVITEKVDVYSFGVVVLEILCGRRNIDRSQPEEDMHLLSIFRRKAEEEQLADIIDKESEDMQEHGEEVVEMMRLAAWCLQSDYSKRPSMSMVVKVLEGSVRVEVELDYSFSYSPLPGKSLAQGYKDASSTTPMLPSTLSGPR